MITNTGKSIIIKYLLGQASTYASYIAVGCGPKPLEQLTFSVINRAFDTSTNVVTLTLDSTHNFVVGDYVTISSVDSFFDGVYQLIAGASSTTIKYTKVSSRSSISALGSNLDPATDPVGKASHNYSNKKSLDYEMFRIPITSRGYVQENGVSKVVLTASIPSADRYEITELGLYPAATNPSAQLSDSRLVYNFVDGEGWEYHNDTTSSEIPVVANKLDLQLPGIIYTGDGAGGTYPTEIYSTTNEATCFIADSSNSTLGTDIRISRYERSRNLGPSIFLRGNSSELISQVAITGVTYTSTTATYTTAKKHGLLSGDKVTVSGLAPAGYNGVFVVTSSPSDTTFVVGNTTNATVTDSSGLAVLPRFSEVYTGSTALGTHIHNVSNVGLSYLDKSSPTDELRFAFSVVNVDAGNTGSDGSDIDKVRIAIKFADSHNSETGIGNFSEMDIEYSASTTSFVNNRYFVAAKQLQELNRYGDFSWTEANVVLVHASVLDSSGNVIPDYYIAFDGIRLENMSSVNPLYGLTGYSVIQNKTQGVLSSYAQPILKLPNTSNFIEFRYSMDVI